jgi:diguanylate cyclase (GGDEF)-like protein
VNDGTSARSATVLQVVAGRLAELAGSFAVARIGGDEFVLLGAGREGLADEAAALADSAVASLAAPIEVAGHDGDVLILQVGASIGVAVTDPGIEVHRLLERADGAMYSVKAAGGRNWSVRLPG